MTHQLRNIFLGLVVTGAASLSLVAGADDEVFTGNFPVVSGKGALIVSGKGYQHRELYDDGEVPTLSAYDSAGQPLPDGVYQFQFNSSPPGGPSSARQRDGFRGNDATPAEGGGAKAVQLTGTFEVLGGSLIYQ